jgi:hypothetical protein
MGRRGQREREKSLVSFDVLPALRADGVLAPLQSGRICPASKVVPQDFVFPVLVPPWGNEDFFVVRRIFYEASDPAMATLTPAVIY